MPATTTRRPRRRKTESVADIERLVNQLIKENHALKKQLSKLQTNEGNGRRPEARLRTLIGKLERTLDGAGPGAIKRAATSATPRTRKPVSPEVAEKRRAALAKAREVRAARRAAGPGP